MVKCSKCDNGKVTYDEDGRTVTDVCYHCLGSGSIDEDTHFHDRLGNVGKTLAYLAESEYRQWRNEDPEGEGYDFCAAENMMTSYDYFTARCWDRESEIQDKLLAMPLADQELLIAWNELPLEDMGCFVRSDSGVCIRGTRGCIRHKQRQLSEELVRRLHESSEEDIPF